MVTICIEKKVVSKLDHTDNSSCLLEVQYSSLLSSAVLKDDNNRAEVTIYLIAASDELGRCGSLKTCMILLKRFIVLFWGV